MPSLFHTKKTSRERRSDFLARENPARLKRVHVMIDEGKTWPEVAEAENVSVPAIWDWCTRHDVEARRLITRNGMTRSTASNKSPDEIIFVLKLLAGIESKKWTGRLVARKVGITPAAVCLWRKRYAPFGVGEALDLYMEDEEEFDHFYDLLDEFVAIPPVENIPPISRARDRVSKAYAVRRDRERAMNGPAPRFRNESETDVSPETNLKLTFQSA